MSENRCPVSLPDLQCARSVLQELSAADLERLTAPLRPSLETGEAGAWTLLLLDLVGQVVAEREHDA